MQVITLSAFRPETLGQGGAAYCTLAMPCTCVVHETPASVQAKTVALIVDALALAYGRCIIHYIYNFVEINKTSTDLHVMAPSPFHVLSFTSVNSTSGMTGCHFRCRPLNFYMASTKSCRPAFSKNTSIIATLIMTLCVKPNILSRARIPRCNTA